MKEVFRERNGGGGRKETFQDETASHLRPTTTTQSSTPPLPLPLPPPPLPPPPLAATGSWSLLERPPPLLCRDTYITGLILNTSSCIVLTRARHYANAVLRFLHELLQLCVLSSSLDRLYLQVGVSVEAQQRQEVVSFNVLWNNCGSQQGISEEQLRKVVASCDPHHEVDDDSVRLVLPVPVNGEKTV
ncbi:unnamed protein product [Pleuronectes platessa]|uniref:Uncharacterized protein n=1 Tax=Pleuronectes platessa TaxID=8262 RepID=A0A9N7UKI7_PLEPL|nr:unnamed protein product [Pleuronectes platessa]